jgi:hypothetical protein
MTQEQQEQKYNEKRRHGCSLALAIKLVSLEKQSNKQEKK